MKKLLLICSTFFLLQACSSNNKNSFGENSSLFEKAIKQYQGAEFEQALVTINRFLETRPHSVKFKESLYLKGKILKQLSRANECVEIFNRVTELSKLTKDSFFSYSLYFAGICYELQGETERAIAVYQDALKVKNLPLELKSLELPARLAIAYSRIGEDKVSKRYYDQTKRELEKLKSSRIKILEQKELLSEILMNMGTLTQIYSKGDDFEKYLNSIKLSQEYLGLVFQMDMGTQSERALSILADHFNKAYFFILNLPNENMEDEILSLRSRQIKQKKLAEVLLENIDALEIYLSSQPSNKTKNIDKQLMRIKEVKESLELILKEKNIGQGLTPEAQKLQNSKLPGKIIDNKTHLEEEALQAKPINKE